MRLHQLSSPHKTPSRKRRGQGNATGNGTYAGRGCNGQKSRSGGKVRLGFEGGQTPLIQRMPKRRGFNNPCKIEMRAIGVSKLITVFQDGDSVCVENLISKGLMQKTDTPKILDSGEKIEIKLQIKGIACSQTAKKTIETAGGSVE